VFVCVTIRNLRGQKSKKEASFSKLERFIAPREKIPSLEKTVKKTQKKRPLKKSSFFKKEAFKRVLFFKKRG
jgi:hypothetical protein